MQHLMARFGVLILMALMGPDIIEPTLNDRIRTVISRASSLDKNAKCQSMGTWNVAGGLFLSSILEP